MKIDTSTLIGVFLGFGMVIMGMILASAGDIGLMTALYINQPSSAAITVGGSIGAVLMSTPFEQVKKIGQIYSKAVFEDGSMSDYGSLIRELVDYATEARRNGVLALDARTEEIEDLFIKSGIQLAVDGTAPEQIEEIMELELDAIKKRHESNQAILSTWAEMAPAYGMIGTLIGLIAMLANMGDPSTIGPSMAIALITTMYGSMVANMLCIPFGNKLKARTEEEIVRKQIIINGILSIQNGDNPRIVKQKLLTYTTPDVREDLADDEEEA